MAERDDIAETLEPLRLKLEADRAAIREELKPLELERDAIVAQIQPLEAQLRDVQRRIKAIEQPRLREIGNKLASIARAKGARTLTNTPQ